MAQTRLPARRDSGVNALRPEEYVDALELCAKDPVSSVLAASQILPAMSGALPIGCEILGFWSRGRLTGVCWSGANLVPVQCDARASIALAHHVRRQGRRCSSIIGDAPTVANMWDVLKEAWPRPREIRENQRSLEITQPSEVDEDPEVRLSQPEEFDLVFPACVSMFAEEVGYSPLLNGGGPGYAARIHNLIASQRSFVRIAKTPHGSQVVFKAEVGATALGVAQIQGVWVHPDFRGQGISVAAMATVVNHTRKRIAGTVSLYVNDYNLAALAAYQHVGFSQVGVFTTVLF